MRYLGSCAFCIWASLEVYSCPATQKCTQLSSTVCSQLGSLSVAMTARLPSALCSQQFLHLCSTGLLIGAHSQKLFVLVCVEPRDLPPQAHQKLRAAFKYLRVRLQHPLLQHKPHTLNGIEIRRALWKIANNGAPCILERLDIILSPQALLMILHKLALVIFAETILAPLGKLPVDQVVVALAIHVGRLVLRHCVVLRQNVILKESVC